MRLQPGEVAGQHGPRRYARADRTRVQVDERRGCRHPRGPLGQTVIVPEQVHRIDRIGTIQDRHRCGQSQGFGVGRDHLVRDGMERPALQASRGLGTGAHGGGPGHHVVGRPTREGEQEDPLRRDATVDQACNPGGQRSCLPRPGSRQDDQRRLAVSGGRQLCVVQTSVPPGIEHTFEGRRCRLLPRRTARMLLLATLPWASRRWWRPHVDAPPPLHHS